MARLRIEHAEGQVETSFVSMWHRRELDNSADGLDNAADKMLWLAWFIWSEAGWTNETDWLEFAKVIDCRMVEEPERPDPLPQ